MEDPPRLRPPKDNTTGAPFDPPPSARQGIKNNSNNGHHRHKHDAKRHLLPYHLRKRTVSDGSTRGSLCATSHTKPPSHVKVVNTKKNKKTARLDITATLSDDVDANYNNSGWHIVSDGIHQSHNHAPLPRYPQSHLGNYSAITSPKKISDRQPDYSVNRYGSASTQNSASVLSRDDAFSDESTNLDSQEKTRWKGFIAHFVYDKQNPEFTTVQQYFWSCMIGTLMGVLTAGWGWIIDFCVNFVWKTVPEVLLQWGVFTDVDGPRPLPHYMWICPALFGGVLSYLSVHKKIPSQGKWIDDLHRVGIMDWSTLMPTILISTAGMASGLSLGPEMPLVLSAGMIGSSFAVRFKQSVLSARVMNLTAASAAVAGFFGFPLTGALFVLELPHRMGLQYYEAFSPATLASIVAVLVNRMVLPDDEVEGKFAYPPRTEALHKNVFLVALIYGVVGLVVGVGYAEGVLLLKKWVFSLFRVSHENNIEHKQQLAEPHNIRGAERVPLIPNGDLTKNPQEPTIKAYKYAWCLSRLNKMVQLTKVSPEPKRAAAAGMVAGAFVGVICMFVPHSLFWGEAQLQTLIDRGMTPLPIFGYGQEPTAQLVAYGYCLIDPEDGSSTGFSTACAGIISVTKIIVIGLSLGTVIIGGHFWGPLYVGCAASHLFVDLCILLGEKTGFEINIVSQPGVAMLCIMGSAHVVTFRAHMAIMLVLSLSIKAFSPEINNYNADDYLAIFPLLVVSCFVSLMTTKTAPQFYTDQQCRGDIIVIPEALCEPNKMGQMGDVNSISSSSSFLSNDSGISMEESTSSFCRKEKEQVNAWNETGETGWGNSSITEIEPDILEPESGFLHVSKRSISSVTEKRRGLHRRTRSDPFVGRIENFTDSLLEQGRASRSRSNSASRPPSRSNSRASLSTPVPSRSNSRASLSKSSCSNTLV